MIYITGDTHGDFSRLRFFCKNQNTSNEDTIIILGDAGLNYYLNKKDIKLKQMVSNIPITLFCVRGNHEERPENISTYKTKEYWGGIVFYEEEFPNILFAKDGEEYNINGKKCLVLGGAYSVDKYYRLSMGYHWFSSEQLSDNEKELIFKKINGKYYDYVFSHTCPYNTRPVHLFLQGIDQSTVDSSMEYWLQKVADSIIFKKWFFGHYHDDWINGNYEMLFTNIQKIL